MKAYICILAGALALSACAHQPPRSTAAADLKAVVARYTEAAKHVDPYYAPQLNVEEELSKFGDYPSPDYLARARALTQNSLSELARVPFTELGPDDARLYRLFEGDLSSALSLDLFPDEYLAFNQMTNRLTEFQESADPSMGNFPFDSVKHYRDFLARAGELPAYVDRQIAVLREGIAKNITLNCTVAPKVPGTYRDSLAAVPEENAFYQPIKKMPAGFSEAERGELTQSYRRLIAETIAPSYRRFDEFFRREYQPHCRHGFGLKGLPQADAWYRGAVRRSTDLDLEPRDLHEKGKQEVARISRELEAYRLKAGARGSLREYLRRRIKDPASYFTSADAMFRAFAKAKAATAAQIPKYFSLVPKGDYRIVETSNPESAAGAYMGPTDLSPEGRFVVNTKNLKSVPIYGVNTLLLHEAVPGHHFQVALAFEMKDQLTDYQRLLFASNSFPEGWALYAEFLGNEMGLLQDPDQRFGHLDAEMLRAVRLVVDTGIHAFGWSQKQAMAYARQYLALDERSLEIEINRYSVMPGQALGYKVGQLKILELRREAEAALGDRFDLKGFHGAVIGHGMVSLPVLEDQVHAWVDAVAGGKAHP